MVKSTEPPVRWGGNSALSLFDFMGKNYNIHIDGWNNVKSPVGGLICIIYFIAMYLFLLYYLVDYFADIKYQSIMRVEDTQGASNPINLLEYRRLPLVRFKDFYTGEFMKEAQVLSAMDVVFQTKSSVSDVFAHRKPKFKTFRFSNCSNYEAELKNYFQDVPLFNFNLTEIIQDNLCLNFTELADIRIYDGTDTILLKQTNEMHINIYPCNALYSPNGCNATLQNFPAIVPQFGFIEPKVSFESYYSPLSYSLTWYQDLLSITPGRYDYVTLDVVMNKVIDDRGLLYPSREWPMYTTVELNSKTMTTPESLRKTVCSIPYSDKITECGYSMYLTVGLRRSIKTTESTRVYKGILDVIGTLGGIKEILTFIFTYLHMFLTSSNYKKQLVENVFGIVPDSTSYLCWRKKKGEAGKKDSRGSYFVPVETFNKAFDTIMKTIDLRTLSHEMFVLRFLSSALLRDYQLNLVPLIALNHYATEEKQVDAGHDAGRDGHNNGTNKKMSVLDHNESRNVNNVKTSQVHPQSPSKGEDPKVGIGKDHPFAYAVASFVRAIKSDASSMIPKVEQSLQSLKDSLGKKGRGEQAGLVARENRTLGAPGEQSTIFIELLAAYFDEHCFNLLETSQFTPFSPGEIQSKSSTATLMHPAKPDFSEEHLNEEEQSQNSLRLAVERPNANVSNAIILP